MKLNLCAPCLFGLEGPLGSELRYMGMENVAPENGRVRFVSDENGLAKANIRSRFAERILLELGRFPARTFDELFEGVRALKLENFIQKNGAFPVKGWALESALHSIPDCQKIIKKAAAERLKASNGQSWCPEDGALYQIQFSILKDECSIYLDSSGVGLHKRGYRPAQVVAPLRETLAAAMVDISGYRGRGDFVDPFCGSGTIAIEAALAAKNRAPGINRNFSAEHWAFLNKKIWSNAKAEARAGEFSGEYSIFASDNDPAALHISRANAKLAGVGDIIRFELADATQFSRKTERGVIVTNPPYGERLMEKRECENLYAGFGRALREVGGWSSYIISSHEQFENSFGAKADKKRKLYNGMIKCDLYIYR